MQCLEPFAPSLSSHQGHIGYYAPHSPSASFFGYSFFSNTPRTPSHTLPWFANPATPTTYHVDAVKGVLKFFDVDLERPLPPLGGLHKRI